MVQAQSTSRSYRHFWWLKPFLRFVALLSYEGRVDSRDYEELRGAGDQGDPDLRKASCPSAQLHDMASHGKYICAQGPTQAKPMGCSIWPGPFHRTSANTINALTAVAYCRLFSPRFTQIPPLPGYHFHHSGTVVSFNLNHAMTTRSIPFEFTAQRDKIYSWLQKFWPKTQILLGNGLLL